MAPLRILGNKTHRASVIALQILPEPFYLCPCASSAVVNISFVLMVFTLYAIIQSAFSKLTTVHYTVCESKWCQEKKMIFAKVAGWLTSALAKHYPEKNMFIFHRY